MSKHRGIHLVLLLILLGLIGRLTLPSPRGKVTDIRISENRAITPPRAAPEKRDVFTRFDDWRQKHATASPAHRKDLLEEGLALANARRTTMARLAREEPARALARLMSLAELAALPPAIKAVCEQPVSAIGSIDLRWLTDSGERGEPSCRHQSIAFADGQSWRVNGPDFRDAKPPRADVPIDGHVIDGELLMSLQSVRKLDRADLAAANQTYPAGNPDGIDPVTGNPATPDAAALIGGKVFHFENEAVISQVVTRLAEADREATLAKTYKPAHGFTWLEADGGTGTDQAPVEATPFFTDNIDVLFIRVDFSDKPGEPVSQANLESALTSVDNHIRNYSYGAASITGTVTSQLYRMPSPSTTYTSSSSGSNNLLTAARNAAAADHTLANYDVVAVYFPALTGTDFQYSGLASVGGGNHWINGLTSQSSRISVMVHEFGHNFGLRHSNYWDPAQQIAGSYAGPGFASLEYGDIFDRMGSADPASGYFSPFSTARLNWLPAGKIIEPTSNGTWRIHRFDSPTALANPLLALRVPIGGSEYWWVGLRKLFPAISNSAYVVAEGLYTDRPNLIDMTPGSLSPESSDRSDAGLPVGGNFYDPAKGVRFQTLASGGTAPNEWIDVKITFDSRIQLADTSVEADENAGSAVLTLRRTFGSAGIATVNYATANGTAVAGADYHAVSGTVTWADGDMADKQVLVPLRPDALNDGGENFTFTLSGVSGATLVTSQSTGTVTLRDAGQLLTEFNADYFNTTVNAIAPLADGKVIIGGNINAGLTGNIARLNADGTEDETFLKGTGFNSEVRCIAIQSDGKILVGGFFTSYNATPCNRFVRLNADGTVDDTFVTNMGPGADNNVHAVAIETTGKILVGGEFASFSGATLDGLVRLTSNGTPDAPLLLPYDPSWASKIYSIIAQSDGRIMTAGYFYVSPVATGFRSGVARLLSNGTRDPSFDPDAGLHLAGSRNTLVPGRSVILQPDGKYVIGGSFTGYDENTVPYIVRVNSNGTFDASFTPPAFNGSIENLQVQPGGMIVAVGSFTSPANRIERLLPNGTVDTTFQQGSGPAGNLYTAALGADGSIWAGGNFYQYNGTAVRPFVKLAGGTSAYDAWVSKNFSSAQIAAGLADPGDDTDNDGINNLAEMAMGSSPVAFNSLNSFAPLAGSTGIIANGPQHFLQSTFARSAANPGIWLAAQFSTGLGNWQPANPLPGNNTTYDIIEDTSTRFTVRDKTAAETMPGRFMRFVVIKPE